MNVPGSANSVLVKVRAMYSDRLTAADFTSLFALQDTAQLAEYLKTKTCYSQVLSGFSASARYVGQLHGLLRERLFEQLSLLGRYERSIDKAFYTYYIYKNDCFQLLARLRTLDKGVDENYVSAFSSRTDKLSYLDLFALARAQSIDEVVAVLGQTEYKALGSKISRLYGSPDGLVMIEEEMQSFCCEKLLSLIKKDSKGSDRAQLIRTVSYCTDVETLINIYRLKRIGVADEGIIRRCFFSELSLLTPRQREAIITAADHNEVAELAENTVYAQIFKGTNPEAQANRLKVEHCKKRLRFTGDSSEAIWCYQMLREYEINDIMNIFEGVRCKVPVEYIKEYIYCVSL